MGKGLSRLQNDILAVLEEFPASQDFPSEGSISLARLGTPAPNPRSSQPTLHRVEPCRATEDARRLDARGKVDKASGERASQGKSSRYVRID
jgi:hypothetical protein